jgi:hypothetical protein
MAGRFLVYVEGETEATYVKELLTAYNCQELGDVVIPKDRSPLGIIRELSKEVWWSQVRDKTPYENGWAVFDQDHHPSYDEAISIAEKLPYIHAVWSNPCLEAWFLMHYEDVSKTLEYDSSILLNTDNITVHIDEDEWNELTIKKFRRAVNPERALERIQDCFTKYKKNSSEGYLPTLLPRLNQAMGFLHNTTNSKHPGSAFPEFIRYLEEVGHSPDMPEETPETASESAPVIPTSEEGSVRSAAAETEPAKGGQSDAALDFASLTLKTPKHIRDKFAKIFENVKIEPADEVKECFKDVKKFLAKYPFFSANDLGMAQYALMTAALGKFLPHTPYIILNCNATGKAKEYFEDVLCRLFMPVSQKRTAFPTDEKAVQNLLKQSSDYVVLSASGKLHTNLWFDRLWETPKAPLVVIIGNQLDVTELGNRALHIRFNRSVGPNPYTEQEIEAEVLKLRNLLRHVSFYRNIYGNKVMNTKLKLTLWRGMVQTPLEWMKVAECTNHLKNQI